MKRQWQTIGALAALFGALAYCVGFVFMLGVLGPALKGLEAPGQKLVVLLGMAPWITSWYIVIYVLFGVALTVLVVVLHEALAGAGSLKMKVASAFGLMWAGMVIAAGMLGCIALATAGKLHAQYPEQAVTAWHTLSAVQEGLGGGIEVVGGLWLVLVSLSARALSCFPRWLNFLGIGVGVAGLLTVLPPLTDLGAVFGVGQIVWFSWLGIVLLNAARSAPAASRLP